MNLNEFLEQLSIPSGITRRFDCPVCGSRNSFSVTNQLGMLVYNCFVASCPTRGAKGTRVTLEDIQQAFVEKDTKSAPISFPPHFIPVDYVGCKKYFTLHPCMVALEKGYLQIYLDVKEQRLVFPVWKQGKIVDATGRTLVKGTKPKWKRYGRSEWPFICGSPDSRVAVVVEDCISAAAVAGTEIYTGVAIMGTSIHSGYTEWLKQFQRVILAMDYDAACKSITGARNLSWVLPTHPVVTKKDLKEYSTEEIKRILDGS